MFRDACRIPHILASLNLKTSLVSRLGFWSHWRCPRTATRVSCLAHVIPWWEEHEPPWGPMSPCPGPLPQWGSGQGLEPPFPSCLHLQTFSFLVSKKRHFGLLLPGTQVIQPCRNGLESYNTASCPWPLLRTHVRSNNVQNILAVLAELLLKMSSLFFKVLYIKTHRNSHKISESRVWGFSHK